MPTFPLAHRNAQLDAHFTRTRKRIEAETIDEHHPTPGATAGGDERRLRGIPVIADGVAGHVPGTRP